jgi:hypothetical protein
MKMNNRVIRLECPRCGENAYLECAYWYEVDEEIAGYSPVFHFCFKCGYSGTDYEPVDPEDAPRGNDSPNTFSGFCCLKLRNGHFEYYEISGDTTDEIISWFTSVLREPDIDPVGSYLNRLDEEAKTILRIGVGQGKG